MKFEVRRKEYGKEKTFFVTHEQEFLPTQEEIAEQEKAGYISYLNGKRYRPKKDENGKIS